MEDVGGSTFSLMMTENGVKTMAHGDFRDKFREIIWTADVNKELPIRVLQDKLGQEVMRGLSSDEAPVIRTPGSEPALTMSQAFLEKVKNLYNEECMKMLYIGRDGLANVFLYTW